MYTGYKKIPTSSAEWKNFNPKIVKCWYITEKVHGSCFCFIFDCKTNDVICGKRKFVLKDDEIFFGYKTVLTKLNDKIKSLCNNIKEKYQNAQKIYVYGELFGSNVQNGIYYSDELNFYAFDISFFDMNEEIYLDFEESLKLFQHSNLLHANPLAKFSKLEDALNFNYNFQSRLSQELEGNLVENNKAEGIVIRSSNGRFLVKRKIDEFSESKYQDNDYDCDNISPLEKAKKDAIKCLTQNRLNNAISKYGEYEKYKEHILEELCMDILTEINGFQFYELKDWL